MFYILLQTKWVLRNTNRAIKHPFKQSLRLKIRQKKTWKDQNLYTDITDKAFDF